MTYGYQLRRVADPETEALSLAEVKQYLNLDDDIVTDDELIEDLWIPAARESVENYCKLSLIDSIYELALDEFPCNGRIPIPIGPVIDVISIQYRGSDGVLTELDGAEWHPVLFDEPARIDQLQSGPYWPAVTRQAGSVLITLRAGYASAGSPQDGTRVPKGLKVGMQMLIAHWYEHREAVSTDHRNTPTEIPLGMTYLFDPYRRIF